MEKIATDIYTFEELRKKGFYYIDKTAIIWPLVNESIGKQFFIARPRRFGKSLLISTLRALFYSEEAGRWTHSQFSHFESVVERLSELREKEKKV